MSRYLLITLYVCAILSSLCSEAFGQHSFELFRSQESYTYQHQDHQDSVSIYLSPFSYPELLYKDFTSLAASLKPKLPELSKKSLLNLTGILLVYAVLDRPISNRLYDKKTNFVYERINTVTRYTKNPVRIGLYGTVLGLIFQKDRFTETSFTLLESGFITSGLVYYIKYLTGRARPVQEEDPDRFYPLREGFSSLPSWHTANIFATAAVVSNYYSTLTVLAYTIAGFVGFQRIYTGAHWPTDVIVGAFLGHYIGKKLTRIRSAPLLNRLSVFKNGIGMAFSF